MTQALPIIDISVLDEPISTKWDSVVQQIDAACRDKGFFYVVGHSIPNSQFKSIEKVADQFFSLDQAQKNQINIKRSSNHRGWGQLAAEQLDPSGEKDCKETFDMALDLGANHPRVLKFPELYGPNQYPNIDGFAQKMVRHYELSLQVGIKILKAMALALGEKPEFFTQHFNYPISVLRLIQYPPATQSIAAGAHTDYGCITLLYQDQLGGLQVKNIDDNWIEAPPIAGSFVVNIGDLMQRWTNGRYKSTPHRVQSPSSGKTRFSMPFFVEPDFETPVETIASCIDSEQISSYPPITAGEWILSKFAQTYDYRNDN